MRSLRLDSISTGAYLMERVDRWLPAVLVIIVVVVAVAIIVRRKKK